MIEGICGSVIGHVTPNHSSVKFDSDRSRESEFKTFLIRHVTLCDHVMNRLCDLMDNEPTLEPITL